MHTSPVYHHISIHAIVDQLSCSQLSTAHRVPGVPHGGAERCERVKVVIGKPKRKWPRLITGMRGRAAPQPHALKRTTN